MMRSLDGTHTVWKNCPKGWHGSYKGKEAKPAIVIEAISIFNYTFGMPPTAILGLSNYISIVSLPLLLGRMVNGELHRLEEEPGTVAYQFGKDTFSLLLILTDEIYPRTADLYKGSTNPSHCWRRSTLRGKRDAEKLLREPLAS
jgi:hypothetical protein